jgi:hypothetical protein
MHKVIKNISVLWFGYGFSPPKLMLEFCCHCEVLRVWKLNLTVCLEVSSSGGD